jgi:hypothetical protein
MDMDRIHFAGVFREIALVTLQQRPLNGANTQKGLLQVVSMGSIVFDSLGQSPGNVVDFQLLPKVVVDGFRDNRIGVEVRKNPGGSLIVGGPAGTLLGKATLTTLNVAGGAASINPSAIGLVGAMNVTAGSATISNAYAAAPTEQGVKALTVSGTGAVALNGSVKTLTVTYSYRGKIECIGAREQQMLRINCEPL